MNLGTENKKKTIAAACLGALALALIIYQFLPGSAPSTPTPALPASSNAPAAASTRLTTAPAPARRNGGKTVTLPRLNSLDPTIRLDMLQAAESQHYHSSGRNIFEARAAETAPKAVPVSHPQPTAPPPPPPPPPINLHFYGFTTNAAGGATRIFLSQGDEVFIAKEGDLVANRYRILHVNPTSIQVEDVLNNNQQTLPLQNPPAS